MRQYGMNLKIFQNLMKKELLDSMRLNKFQMRNKKSQTKSLYLI